MGAPVQDILDAISEIHSFVGTLTFEEFRSDVKTIRAIGADLVIIGEAASHIPDEVQAASSDVPWHLMRAMRNRIVHTYFDIDSSIVWEIIQNDLPQIVEPLRKLGPGAD